MGAVPEVWDLTTVAEDEVVFHLHSPDSLESGRPASWSGPGYEVITALRPATPLMRHGIATRTLERPAGELLCRFATVNDVHFGETECGRISDISDAVGYLTAGGADAQGMSDAKDRLQALFDRLGPALELSSPEGTTPYPELMSPRGCHRDRRHRPGGGRRQGRPHSLGPGR